MTYDCVVQRRIRYILQRGKENRELVASMFPKKFRSQIFQKLSRNELQLGVGSHGLGTESPSAHSHASSYAPSRVRLKTILSAGRYLTSSGDPLPSKEQHPEMVKATRKLSLVSKSESSIASSNKKCQFLIKYI